MSISDLAQKCMGLVNDNRLAKGFVRLAAARGPGKGPRRCVDFIQAYPDLYFPEEYQR